MRWGTTRLSKTGEATLSMWLSRRTINWCRALMTTTGMYLWPGFENIETNSLVGSTLSSACTIGFLFTSYLLEVDKTARPYRTAAAISDRHSRFSLKTVAWLLDRIIWRS